MDEEGLIFTFDTNVAVFGMMSFIICYVVAICNVIKRTTLLIICLHCRGLQKHGSVSIMITTPYLIVNSKKTFPFAN